MSALDGVTVSRNRAIQSDVYSLTRNSEKKFLVHRIFFPVVDRLLFFILTSRVWLPFLLDPYRLCVAVLVFDSRFSFLAFVVLYCVVWEYRSCRIGNCRIRTRNFSVC